MANVKSAGVRELIIDKCLQERRGYTITQLMERVNKALRMDGLRPVTSGNTIRNDIENIANRYKQPINRVKRGHAIYFSYRDPTFSKFKCQLSNTELRLFHNILMNLKFIDLYQGSIMYNEMSEALKEQLQLRFYQQPILLYENIPTEKELETFRVLYDCICSQTVVRLTYQLGRAGPRIDTVHPHFMRQQRQQWHLLGQKAKDNNPICLPVRCIMEIEEDEQTEYVPNKKFDVEKYYQSLYNSQYG